MRSPQLLCWTPPLTFSLSGVGSFADPSPKGQRSRTLALTPRLLLMGADNAKDICFFFFCNCNFPKQSYSNIKANSLFLNWPRPRGQVFWCSSEDGRRGAPKPPPRRASSPGNVKKPAGLCCRFVYVGVEKKKHRALILVPQ